MNLDSKFIRYYSQDDEMLSEHLELYEILTEEQLFLIQKRFSRDISNIFAQLNHKSKSNLIKNCNSLRYLQQCISNPEHKHFRGSFCKDRYCPICSHIKSHQETKMLFEIMQSMQKDNNYKNCYLLFTTLTQKNVITGELKSEIKNINNAIKELLKDDLFKPSKRKKSTTGKMVNVKPLCIGTIRHLEVTAGYKKERKRIEYHPHVHLLMLVRKDYWNHKNKQWTHKKLSQKWRQCMDLNYDPVVDIRLVRDKDIKVVSEIKDAADLSEKEIKNNNEIDVKEAKKNNLAALDSSGAIKEISKYGTKDTDLIKFFEDKKTGRIEINWDNSKEIIAEMYGALHHKRTTVMTGEFLKQKKRLFGSQEAEDLIDNLRDAELIDLFKNKKCKKCGSDTTEHLLRYHGKKKVYLELGQDKLENYKKGINNQIKNLIDRRKNAKKNTDDSDQTNHQNQ